jgi:hypothetical protein
MSATSIRKVGAVSALLASGLVAGGVLASTVSANAAEPTPTASSSTSSASRPASTDTAVTGTAADDVIAAVKAKYSTVTITTVRKDADGSFDAVGTDATGNEVFYDVSADLKTISAAKGGPGGGHRGGPGGGGGQDIPVTGAAATSVINAVKGTYSTVTITTVRKDPDGSFDALGTDATGNKVFYDVSADLKTVSANR